MNQTLYYVRLDNEQFGPFSLDTLIDVHLTPDISVRSTATNKWLQACEYHELTGSLDYSLLEMRKNMSKKQDMEKEPEPRRQEPAAAPSAPKPETAPQTQGKADNSEEIAEILNQLQSLLPAKKQIYKRVFPTIEAELDFLISEYDQISFTLLGLAKRLAKACNGASLGHRVTAKITESVNGIAKKINEHYESELNRLHAEGGAFTTASVLISRSTFTLTPPLEDVEITCMNFLKVLSDYNLCVTYEPNSEDKALDFVNNIVGKLYENNAPRLIATNVVDANFMTGIDDSFKLLNRDLYTVVSRPDEIRATLASLQNRASSILRNLLVEKGATLQDYNSTHENKEANMLLIIKDFPSGLNIDNLETLYKLAKVGPKAGIYVMIIASKDIVDSMTDKETAAFDWKEFTKISNSFHFKSRIDDILGAISSAGNGSMEAEVQYETLSDGDIRNIVKDVNAKCELKEDVVISISDHLPDTAQWWAHDSAKQIEIPFGIGNDMHIKSLKITQESGQNTALAIGIPGSGKSVFLHTLICNAAIKYSPDELRMYLIDFSGVEFNSYALGKLPHARVIAPEAEREFGLSILNELVEEGSRRMALCREHNVSNIVDLKRVAPGIKVPRLLVIIDEFQKLFEVDNDQISKEANSKIHIIIQEFRKFGINLVLATQKLPTSSFLPRDLIANRVVFKSSPGDFDSLITTETRGGMPRLNTGQCVYNSESGASYANEIVQGFFTSKADLDSIMGRIRDFERGYSYEREPMKVFRSADLPVFENRRCAEYHCSASPIPYMVPVYFGESIAVSDVDVNVELVKENANNILVIGGEADIARNIAFNAMRSAVAAHTEHTARVAVLSGMRADNPMNERVSDFINSTPCEAAVASSSADITALLREIREEIDLRRSDETVPQQHIYLTCFDFQSIRALDRDTSSALPKMSAAAKDLDLIIRNGSSVGVFTILQTDTLDSLNRISQSAILPMFNFRIVLQMSEDASYKIIGSPAANKLFVFNRPSSRFRGYVRDNARNLTVKFKPYK